MNNTPGVHRIELHRLEADFYMTPNKAVRDPRISANSFRLLAYLLSHKDGYKLTYRQIEKQTGLGRYAINAASKQLSELGWLQVEQTKLPSGQFGAKSWGLLTPDDDAAVAGGTVAGQSVPDSSRSGTAHGLKKTIPEEHYLEQEDHKERKVLVEQAEIVSYSEDAFETWWDAYPLKKAKGAAREAYAKARNQVSVDKLQETVEAYRDDPNRGDTHWAYPTTWLNQERWDDSPHPVPAQKARKMTNAEEGALLSQKYREEESLALGEGNPVVAGQLEADASEWVGGNW